jgi:hypothetical protein
MDLIPMGTTMKKTLASLFAALIAVPAMAADVGVSIEIAQPGVFGRIDIGRFPQPPPIVVPAPVVIAPPPRVVVGPPVQPIYMWVPYAHRKDWRRYCHRYNACGVPVYFVRHDWYDREYRGRRWDDHDRRDRRWDDDRRSRDERRDRRDRRDDDHPGKGKGKGRD